ncbi:hypothetical protein [Streptomyces fuscigenes]|uniref:hypothetical protein n=1 Tax=Streptomyces fuscigenes TaxID=1528880 RepID=UPI001F491BB4|nr:hypothetical protein [Streptomyces fuscigenes]MCF3960505.1 hypothetical protein [Streptomyces fuscigenes]
MGRPRGTVSLWRTVLPGVLVLALAGGAAGYAGHVASHADRTVPTVVWKAPTKAGAPDPAAGTGGGRDDSPLAKALLPVPGDWVLGPDIPGLGNDAVLNKRQATAYLDHITASLPGGGRGARVDDTGIESMALRSYNDLYGGILQMRIVQYANTTAARTASSADRLFAEEAGDDHVKIPHHPSGAVCASARETGPGDASSDDAGDSGDFGDSGDSGDNFEDSGLLRVFCTSLHGDLTVSLVDVAPGDSDPSGAASLFAQQLDRLSTTGKAA